MQVAPNLAGEALLHVLPFFEHSLVFWHEMFRHTLTFPAQALKSVISLRNLYFCWWRMVFRDSSWRSMCVQLLGAAAVDPCVEWNHKFELTSLIMILPQEVPPCLPRSSHHTWDVGPHSSDTVPYLLSTTHLTQWSQEWCIHLSIKISPTDKPSRFAGIYPQAEGIHQKLSPWVPGICPCSLQCASTISSKHSWIHSS